MLQQMSAQLNSFSINPSFINSTEPGRTPDQLQSPFRAPLSAVWINTLWFSSLICSLASASIALIVKQWLHEVSSGLSGASRETARVRQYRLNSLIKWNVGVIVLVPSVLLQTALVLFLSGLLILLWTIHQTVAGVTTCLVGILFLFFFVATVLPTFRWDCCYRSPQALGAFVLARFLWKWTNQSSGSLARWLSVARATGRVPRFLDWVARIIISLHNRMMTLGVRQMPTWNGAEQTEVARETGSLDRHIATMAYTSTFSARFLENMHVILSDLPCEEVSFCFYDIHQAWCRLWGSYDLQNPRLQGLKQTLLSLPLLYGLRNMLTNEYRTRELIGANWERVPEQFICGSRWPYGPVHLPHSERCLSTLALVSIGKTVLARRVWKSLYRRFLVTRTELGFNITYDTFRNGESFGV